MSRFTETEIRFLLGAPSVENYGGDVVSGHFEDMRKKGCPEHLFNRVVEDRARRLKGKRLQEFRNLTSGATVPTVQATPQAEQKLVSQIEAEKLF
jgi:hypothetical protein